MTHIDTYATPMYLAVASVIVAQALLLGQMVSLIYAVLFGLAVATFVLGYEEPSPGPPHIL